MSAAAIEVQDLGFSYAKGVTALDGLTFSVAPGEVFGLLGPNGAGKTTAVRILTTILKPDRGRAFVGGHDVVAEPLAARQQLSAVLQENAVETLLSTRDNLLLCGILHGYSRAASQERSRRVIALLELDSVLGTRAQELSGGYKRRLQVAKALMVDAPVLFLDEATTGMDPLIKRRVTEAIREEARGGRTVLLTTQLMDEAEALCDRMILMNKGRAIAGGGLNELRAHVPRLLTIRLAFATPTEESFAALAGLQPRSLERDGDEVTLVVAGSENEWIRAIADVSERWPLAQLEMRGASLEEIFMEIYSREEQG